MNDLRYRPKNNFIQTANWQELFTLTEHWKSDLLFYKDDLRFLHKLIDNYFMYVSKKENIDSVLDIEVNLLKVDKQCASLLKNTNEHLHYITEFIDNPFAGHSAQFRTDHENLEEAFTEFVKDFRKNRKDVFGITEHIINVEELVRRLNIIST
ncbi:hypothetical protein [Winogradskyella aurantia]|uniref:Uncharacterized protein n=1 Tax=Winogradskyella aurantia TaxID=1915063 RepID=A0A265UWZ2_9FLAO|nr:hypothetical protein [Winogradskyella aurantia]OZV69816.1 hypothetical protein CA834_04120 [Winogradskyella aurantia]